MAENETPEEQKIRETREYLEQLKRKRAELLTGAQSYAIGSRSLARYNIDLRNLNSEIRRVEGELDKLLGRGRPKMKQLVFRDF